MMAAISCLMAAGMLAAPIAWAHDFYALDCCSDKDCGPYPAEHVAIEPGGYRLHTGELIRFHDGRIRPSPDGRYHLCAITYSPGENQIVRCLYVPPIGS